jgi:hypothetical protein
VRLDFNRGCGGRAASGCRTGLEAVPAAASFFPVDAVATVAGAGAASSFVSLICTSTTASGKPPMSTRVLSAGSRIFLTAVTTRSFVGGRISLTYLPPLGPHLQAQPRWHAAARNGSADLDSTTHHAAKCMQSGP